jgi:hypothetical protein
MCESIGVRALQGILLGGLLTLISVPATAVYANEALEPNEVAQLQANLILIDDYHPPQAQWNFTTGIATTDLSFVRSVVLPAFRLVSALHSTDFVPDDVVLEIDGDRAHWIHPSRGVVWEVLHGGIFGEVMRSPVLVPFAAGHYFRQIDVKVVLLKKGKEVWVSEPGMNEDLRFPRVDPDSLKDAPQLWALLPAKLLARNGRDPDPTHDPVNLASRLDHEIVQVTMDPRTTNALLVERFRDHGSSLKFESIMGIGAGARSWKVTDPTDGKVILAAPGDVWAVLNAGFNSNIFKWDGDEANGGLAYSDPVAALNWIQARYEMQMLQGTGIQTRENHAYNLLPYQREDKIKLSMSGPVVTHNGELINPPLTGLAFKDLYRFYPRMGADWIEKMLEMSRWERKALVRDYGRSGKGHDLLGFLWTNVGSGRDNAPRCLGQPTCFALDMITYYKMMLDQEAEFSLYLGKWDNAQGLTAESSKIAGLINDEYWNEAEGLYTDVALKEDGETEHSGIRTMVGFWPMLGRIPSAERVNRMIEESLHNPKRFGDGPFPPSVSADHAGESDLEGALFNWEGHYWRGGFWPIDGRFLLEGLWYYGRRAEAANQFGRMMGGIAEASRAYQNGDSPYALVHGAPSPDEAILMKKQGVFWESYGRVRVEGTQNHQLRATFNRQYSFEHVLHMTRPNLGWSLAFVKRGLKYEEGVDAVPAFLGPESEVPRAVYHLLLDPLYSQHAVARNPLLDPLVKYIVERKLSDADFQSLWAGHDAELEAVLKQHPLIEPEISRVAKGYLEISPSFDPGINETKLSFRYNGASIELSINHPDKNRIELLVKSDSVVRLQFNQNWDGDSQATDVPLVSSSLVEIGGGAGTPVTLPDGSQAWQVMVDLTPV